MASAQPTPPCRPPRPRLLVGPFMRDTHASYMAGAFDDFDTLTFGAWPEAGIQMSGAPSLDRILAQLPPGWQPDLFILWRPEYGFIPAGLELAPFPTATLTSDWYLAFADSLDAARRVDVVVTGTRGARVFAAAGLPRVLALPMLGYEPEVDGVRALPQEQRDLDVFCGGNPSWAIHARRQQITAALLDLMPGVSVHHGPYVGHDRFNALMGRSRLFVNQTVIGELNMKVYEATASETCLLVEEGNLDVARHLEPGRSVVLFNRGNLQEKVRYYLEHEDQRRAVARAGRLAMASFTYRHNFRTIVEQVLELVRGSDMERPRSEIDAAAGRAGHTLRHGGGQAQVLEQLAAPENGGTPELDLIRAVAAYRNAVEHGVGELQPTLDALEQVFRRHPDYLPAAFTWTRIAAAHRPAPRVLDVATHTLRLLEHTAEPPFSSAHHYQWEAEVAFAAERAAWEAVEAGRSPGQAIKPWLQEDLWLLMARLLRAAGHGAQACRAAEKAVACRPAGHRARPLLAEWLLAEDAGQQACRVLDEHLRVHPLDLDAVRRRLAQAPDEGWRRHLARLEILFAAEPVLPESEERPTS